MAKNEINNSSWLSKRNLIWITSIFVLLCIIISSFFFWNRPIKIFSKDYVLDNALWGNFGDFIGGVGGPILAFIGVVITCLIFKEQKVQTTILSEEQNKITQKSIETQQEQSEIQRFNALFFELIKLHRDKIAELKDIDFVGLNSSVKRGTDFFERCAENLHNNCQFKTKSYIRRNNATNTRYLRLYLANSTALAPYFRILFRIFDLIDKANIPDKEKARYAKIVRSQLSENELLMLRYNCSTNYGSKFINYVNKYRLLKHLPLLSLPEFSHVTQLLSSEDTLSQFSLNIILSDINKTVYDIAVKNISPSDGIIDIPQNGRYSLELNFIRNNTISITISINNTISNRNPILKSFRNFQPDNFKYLIEILLKEILVFSNFAQYQTHDSVEISTRIFTSDNVTKIIGIAFSSTAFRLSHPSRDSFYGIQL